MPHAHVDDVRTISTDPHYQAWPTITRRRDGELLLTCSGGRVAHVCPFGRVELIRSRDDGRTWSPPEIVADGPLDDRDAGVLETASGALLVNWFTSLAYRHYKAGQSQAGADPKVRAAWAARDAQVTDEAVRRHLGAWIVRSTDGGSTWSRPIPSQANSPHGPIELADGRLLYAGRRTLPPEQIHPGLSSAHGPEIGVAESHDDGRTWRWLSTIPVAPGHQAHQYHELHQVQAASGRIVAQIRNHNELHQYETLQTESEDGGRTWTTPHSIGVWGFPSHLLRLADDRLLMTYGHRREPLGTLARVSADEGRSWSQPLAIYTQAANTDMGYSSSVQLADGSLRTAWYEVPAGQPAARLRLAVWRLAD